MPSTGELAERLMVGRIIRDARLRAGLAQSEIAGMIGVSPVTLSRWERGEESASQARRALYGFDLSLIAGLDADGVALNPDERALLAAFRHLPEAERRALLELVRP